MILILIIIESMAASHRHTIASLIVAGMLAVAGPSASAAKAAASESGSDQGNTLDANGKREEVSSFKPRVVVAYDGGLLTLDGTTGKAVGRTERKGFLRLSPSGDGRHLFISDGSAFQLFDVGLITKQHKDRTHYYVAPPKLTNTRLDVGETGHVVSNAGRTSLFSESDASVRTIAASALEDGKLTADEIATSTAGEPHHGTAVPLSNGNMLVTKGTEEEHHTIQEVDRNGKVVTETTNCPETHGAASAKPNANGDVISFGCINGPVVYRDGAFHKVPVSEEYQRSGNQFGSTASPYVLADYKTIKPAENAKGVTERPTVVGLINTADNTVKKVDLGSPYWFRSFARGKKGEGLVLTYNGNLNILDPATGTVTKKVKVVKKWREKDDWKQPGPNVKTVGDYAYVTEPSAKKIHLVKISTGKLVTSFSLNVVPNEMWALNGKKESGASG